jgi:hypothetical protein
VGKCGLIQLVQNRVQWRLLKNDYEHTIKGWEFPEHLNDYQLIMKGPDTSSSLHVLSLFCVSLFPFSSDCV